VKVPKADEAERGLRGEVFKWVKSDKALTFNQEIILILKLNNDI
jgi:hypothetical protein